MRVSKKKNLFGLVACSVTASLFFASGCNPPTNNRKDTKNVTVEVDAWDVAAKAFNKNEETSISEFRRVLESLNSDLTNASADKRPAMPSAEMQKLIKESFPKWDETDRNELTSTTFTKLDPVYYLECLKIREAIKSLELSKEMSIADRSKVIMNWISRQMYVEAPIVKLGTNQSFFPPTPPTNVLKRGFGSRTEKAMIALLAFQLEKIDTCLLGAAGSETMSWATGAKVENNVQLPPNGPFWGIGVKTDKGILPFHLLTGAMAVKADNTPAYLADLKVDPTLVKEWTDTTADELKATIPVLALPIQAMSTRWAILESKLDGGTNFAVDAIALKQSFGSEAKFWNSIEKSQPGNDYDGFDYARVLASFVNATEGGKDRSEQQLANLTKILQVPVGFFRLPAEIENQTAKQNFTNQVIMEYSKAFIEENSPKERIMRGAFFEVTKDLVEKERRFSESYLRFQTQQGTSVETKKFLTNLNDLYYSIQTAELKKDEAKIANLSQQLANLNKENNKFFPAVINGIVGKAGAAESTYLLAICKHEVAERFQLKYERSLANAEAAAKVQNVDPKKLATIQDTAERNRQKAMDAWNEATDWWDRYEQFREDHGKVFRGRSTHASELRKIATKNAKR